MNVGTDLEHFEERDGKRNMVHLFVSLQCRSSFTPRWQRNSPGLELSYPSESYVVQASSLCLSGGSQASRRSPNYARYDWKLALLFAQALGEASRIRASETHQHCLTRTDVRYNSGIQGSEEW